MTELISRLPTDISSKLFLYLGSDIAKLIQDHFKTADMLDYVYSVIHFENKYIAELTCEHYQDFGCRLLMTECKQNINEDDRVGLEIDYVSEQTPE